MSHMNKITTILILVLSFMAVQAEAGTNLEVNAVVGSTSSVEDKGHKGEVGTEPIRAESSNNTAKPEPYDDKGLDDSDKSEMEGIEHEDIGDMDDDSDGTRGVEAEEHKSEVSVKAVEVRGWDPEEKQAFLQTVKLHAELHSEQELGNFARGVLLKDGNIDSASFGDNDVEVEYKVPAKFLGIFSSNIGARVSVVLGQRATSSAQSEIDNSDRVKVKMPWYRFLYRLSDEVKGDEIQNELRTELQDSEREQLENTIQERARIFETISNVLKASHDAAMNSIRNIK